MSGDFGNDLAIILPTVNELSNLKILYPELRRAYPGALILIVDDNSTDGTSEYLGLIAQSDLKLIPDLRRSRLGIGNAHMNGMRLALSHPVRFILTMDSDLTHRLEDVMSLYEARDSGDVVIGSRYLPSSAINDWSLFRRFLTNSGHLVTRLFFGSSYDMSSGLRIYKADMLPFKRLQEVCPQNYAFFFVSVLVFRKLRLRIEQVPVILESRASGGSKMSIKLMVKGVGLLILYGFRVRRV